MTMVLKMALKHIGTPMVKRPLRALISKTNLEGALIYWYDNGNKASEGFYKNDKPEGIQRAWNENGQIESEQEYKNGVLNGASIFYENGVKTAEYVFKNGDVVGDFNG